VHIERIITIPEILQRSSNPNSREGHQCRANVIAGGGYVPKVWTFWKSPNYIEREHASTLAKYRKKLIKREKEKQILHHRSKSSRERERESTEIAAGDLYKCASF